ncbi:MAG: Uma2 family endonuclease [Cyanobacteria bacterium J06598_1]
MIASPLQNYMTADEYLAWESRQETRHEYCDGQVFAMAGGTKDHDKLAYNFRRALENRVDEQGCEMTGSDVKVMVNDGRFYRYPDLAVSCDERDRQHETFYEFPRLIVEVLSSSTEKIDRGDKFQDYIQIPTLEEYVLVSTKRMQIECFRRGEGRMWLYFAYREGETVEIASMGVEFPIEQLYKNVQLSTIVDSVTA